MRDAFRILSESLQDVYGEILLVVPLSLVTLLLQLPLITGPPALAAMWAVGNQIARGEAVGRQDYWVSFKEHFWSSWRLTVLNLLVLGVVAANLWFYAPSSNPLDLSVSLASWIEGVWIAVLLLWLLMAQHHLALIMEQKDQRLRVTLRNGAVLLMRHPALCVLELIFIALAVALSALLVVPWFVITPAFLAVLTNNAVLLLVRPDRERGRT
jgi:uncharacterized membrane protein YesL